MVSALTTLVNVNGFDSPHGGNCLLYFYDTLYHLETDIDLVCTLDSTQTGIKIVEIIVNAVFSDIKSCALFLDLLDGFIIGYLNTHLRSHPHTTEVSVGFCTGKRLLATFKMKSGS